MDSIGREVAQYFADIAPVYTGNFAAHQRIIEASDNILKVGVEYNDAPYFHRILEGTTKTGAPFSELAFHMYELNETEVEDLVFQRTEDYVKNMIMF